MVELSIMATRIYKNQIISLFNGKELEIIPLKIRYLREFMEVFENIKEAKSDDESIAVLVECVRICMKQYCPEISSTTKDVEDNFDMPTIYKILDSSAVNTTNLGTWSSHNVVRISSIMGLWSDATADGVASNAYYNNNWYRLTTGDAVNYQQRTGDGTGNHIFQVAGYGTANSAITWTDALTILNGGNVGIGTTSPTANLTVYNSSTPTIDLNTGASTSRGRISATSSDLTIAALTSSPLVFKIDTSEKVRIASDGNVGIGTTSPTQKLDVNGTVLATAFSGPLTGNVTGNATNVTGTVAIANGGTGATSAAAARTNLGIANNYLYAKRTTNQTISTGTWANRDIIFNINSASSGIAYDTATGVASLTGGKVYRITALLSWSRTSAFSAIWSLFNNADNSQLGPDVYNDSVTYTINEFVNPTLDMILAPTSSIDVKIRTTSNMSVYDSSLYVQGTNVCLIIQQIA